MVRVRVRVEPEMLLPLQNRGCHQHERDQQPLTCCLHHRLYPAFPRPAHWPGFRKGSALSPVGRRQKVMGGACAFPARLCWWGLLRASTAPLPSGRTGPCNLLACSSSKFLRAGLKSRYVPYEHSEPVSACK